MTLATSIGLVLIMLLPARAGLEDLLIPSRSLAGTINFINKARDYRITTNSNSALQTAMTSKDTNEVVGFGEFAGSGEISVNSQSLTELGMVKKVLEPGTMLALGVCLLGIGLFAIKFRK